MTLKPQIGKRIYNDLINQGINSNRAVLKALRELNEDYIHSAPARTLMTRAAFNLQENLDALHELERFGERLANKT